MRKISCKNCKCSVVIGCILNFFSIFGDIGSDSAVSLQSLITFIGATNNTVLGFAALGGGFVLYDSSASFSFNAYFPVQGLAGFNGGICYLMRDMHFDSYTDIETSGTIQGNFHTLEFAPRSEILYFPAGEQFRVFDSKSTVTTVYSVDWAPTDTYLLAGTALSSTSSELQIFTWDQENKELIPTSGFNLSVGVNEVEWQPVSSPPYIFAASTTDGVRTFTFDTSSNTVIAIDTKATGSASPALVWAPSGGYLAISSTSNAVAGSDILAIFSVSSGVMTRITTTNTLQTNRRAQRAALAWDNTGSYLAVGTSKYVPGAGTNAATLFLFYYNGSTLSLTQSIRIPPTGPSSRGSGIGCLAWSHDGALLAVGLVATSGESNSPINKIRMFSFNGSSFNEVTAYYNGETQNVYNIVWEDDDSNLAYVRGIGASYELQGCVVNRTTQKLETWAQGILSGNGLGIDWNNFEGPVEHEDIYIAVGDDTAKASVWGVGAKPFVFSDIDIVFNGPVQFKEKVIFNGVCSMTSNNNIIDINNQSIVLTSGAHLTIYNSILYGMGGGQSIVFLDSTSTLTFSQVKMINTRDFYLRGSLNIEGDVVITGTYKITYSTDSICRINDNSQLFLDSGITFSYDPPSGANNLVVFNGPTSGLYLNEVTPYIASSNGLLLTKGKITFNGLCPVIAPHGLFLGDGTSSNDVVLNIMSDSGIKLSSGYLISRLTEIGWQ